MQNFNSEKTERKLSIIIVNFRSEQFLKRCIASIYNCLDIDFEIIVVNNDEKEKLISVAQNFPEIKILNNEKNIGFGSAVNVGTKLARGEFLFFINPDAFLKSREIGETLKILENNEKIAAIGLKIIDKNGKNQEWICGFEATFFDLIKNNLGFSRSKKVWEKKNKIFVHWVSGAAMLVKKNIFERLGGFDENFFMYFEDLDLCKRARKLGFKILYFPKTEIVHESGGSLKNRKQQKKYYYASQDYYFQKHFNKIKGLLIKILRKITHV